MNLRIVCYIYQQLSSNNCPFIYPSSLLQRTEDGVVNGRKNITSNRLTTAILWTTVRIFSIEDGKRTIYYCFILSLFPRFHETWSLSQYFFNRHERNCDSRWAVDTMTSVWRTKTLQLQERELQDWCPYKIKYTSEHYINPWWFLCNRNTIAKDVCIMWTQNDDRYRSEINVMVALTETSTVSKHQQLSRNRFDCKIYHLTTFYPFITTQAYSFEWTINSFATNSTTSIYRASLSEGAALTTSTKQSLCRRLTEVNHYQ